MKIAIVGLGLIGGSMARRLIKQGHEITGVDVDESVLNTAKSKGIITHSATSGEAAIADADVTILCLYFDIAIEFLRKNGHNFKRGSILTDCTGVKTPLMKLCETLEMNAVYVGMHPMAGLEKCGFEQSSEHLFDEANFLITPSNGAMEAQINIVEALARELNCGKITRCTPEEHDKMVAYTSQLPHVLAACICNSPNFGRHKSFVGNSFADYTRIACINEEMWSQLFVRNMPSLVEAISLLTDELSIVRDMLVREDEGQLREYLRKVREKYEAVYY
ncbi:MAG: prephenate dehydrogenase [Clostridiales bacterium]|jgi:prephenate dehydrogenase|nr:prephenate dehydrogenase [Clostridiales bacterium]